MEGRPIRIVVINGSVRPGNYTGMASKYVVDELRKHPKVSVEVVDPAVLNLPFPGTDPHSAATKKLQDTVRAATAVIFRCHEYHAGRGADRVLQLLSGGRVRIGSGKGKV